MSWTSPKTYSVGEVDTAADRNTYERDNLNYLKGQAGQVIIDHELLAGHLGTMRVQRHPYGADRHIESGNVSGTESGAGISVSVTFTDAYSGNPNTIISPDGLGYSWGTSSISTSGFTAIGTGPAGSRLAFWMSDGAD